MCVRVRVRVRARARARARVRVLICLHCPVKLNSVKTNNVTLTNLADRLLSRCISVSKLLLTLFYLPTYATVCFVYTSVAKAIITCVIKDMTFHGRHILFS